MAAAHTADANVVSDAVDVARRASERWRRTGWADRAALLQDAERAFRSRRVEIAGLISAETGKTRLEAVGEADEAADLIHTYCAEIGRHNGFVRPMDSLSSDETSLDVLRPYGVFGVICPFNYPVALLVNMAAAALLTGNTAVLKPSDKTPRSSALAADILRTTLPAGTLNVVHGGPATGSALADAVDGIAFTGSASVGWGLVRRLTGVSCGRPVLAEMGGKNPAVVTESADLDAAADGIVRSAFGLSGQKCSSCSRAVVHADVHDQLVERILDRVGTLRVADPLDAEAALGPVADEAAVFQVRGRRIRGPFDRQAHRRRRPSGPTRSLRPPHGRDRTATRSPPHQRRVVPPLPHRHLGQLAR